MKNLSANISISRVWSNPAADIQARMQRFVATVSQTSSKFGRDLESADLRYENGYALKLRGVTTVGDAKKDRN